MGAEPTDSNAEAPAVPLEQRVASFGVANELMQEMHGQQASEAYRVVSYGIRSKTILDSNGVFDRTMFAPYRYLMGLYRRIQLAREMDLINDATVLALTHEVRPTWFLNDMRPVDENWNVYNPSEQRVADIAAQRAFWERFQ